MDQIKSLKILNKCLEELKNMSQEEFDKRIEEIYQGNDIMDDLKIKDTEIDEDNVTPIPVNFEPLDNLKFHDEEIDEKEVIPVSIKPLEYKKFKEWHEMPHTYIECDCKSELIRLVFDVDSFNGTAFLYLSIFTEYYNDWSIGWKQKFKHIWNILRKGSPWADQICLRTADIKKLRDYLNSLDLGDEYTGNTVSKEMRELLPGNLLQEVIKERKEEIKRGKSIFARWCIGIKKNEL